jgi:hypothetical protein
MKNLRRYGFIAVGLPNLIGFALVAVVCPIVAGRMVRNNDAAVFAVADVLCGLITVFAGVLLTSLLGMQATVILPMVSAVWFAIHFLKLNRFPEFLRACLGIVCGWLIYELLPRV